MTEKLADRTFRAALSMWEQSGLGRKPERSDCDCLDASPDDVPSFGSEPSEAS